MVDTLGKGMFVWSWKNLQNGDVNFLVEMIKKLELDHVILKIGDASSNHSQSYLDMTFVMNTLRREIPSLQVWAWHYVYGGAYRDRFGIIHYNWTSPEHEALFAIDAVNRYKFDGYVIDAEKEYKYGYDKGGAIDPINRASRYMNVLKNIGVPIALSSYRYPSLHRDFAWEGFLSRPYVKYHMPQVYWGNYPDAPISELNKSITQLRAVKDLPFITTGRAYIGDGHAYPVGKELTDFMVASQSSKHVYGVNFWALDFLRTHKGGILRELAIQDFTWTKGTVEQPTPEPIEEAKDFIVTASWLRVRSGPDQSYSQVGALRYGTPVKVYDFRLAGYLWGRIHPTKSEWVATNFMRLA